MSNQCICENCPREQCPKDAEIASLSMMLEESSHSLQQAASEVVELEERFAANDAAWKLGYEALQAKYDDLLNRFKSLESDNVRYREELAVRRGVIYEEDM